MVSELIFLNGHIQYFQIKKLFMMVFMIKKLLSFETFKKDKLEQFKFILASFMFKTNN